MKVHRWCIICCTSILLSECVFVAATDNIVTAQQVPSIMAPIVSLSDQLNQRHCEAGTVYTITSVQDLENQLDQLECIFWAADAPKAIPLGPMPGTALKIFSHDRLEPLVNVIWHGKIAFKTFCDGQDIGVLFNIAGGGFRYPAYLTIETLNENLTPGEFNDGKRNGVVDYTRDFKELCPNVQPLTGTDFGFEVLTEMFPFDQIVDLFRVVGRSTNGDAILLGKTLIRDTFKEGNPATTMAYWAIWTSDDRTTDFPIGASLPPLSQSFDYVRANLISGINPFLPFNELIDSPVFASQEVANVFLKAFNVFQHTLETNLRRAVDSTDRVVQTNWMNRLFRWIGPGTVGSVGNGLEEKSV